jgi:DNA (cytosine-5)-methyltransferase 1
VSPRSYGVALRRTEHLRLQMHADSPDPGAWRAWVNESNRPIAIDLFCGAGGLSHGLESAGYRVALAVDTDDWALETHRHNFEGPALNLDLSSPQARDQLIARLDGVNIDLVAGGPPCQPFSRAGRSKIRSLVEQGLRASDDSRQELWRAFLDIVERVRPRTVLMENVPDMALGDDGAVLRVMISRLETSGYDVDARIVDAWLHGVPQHRQRLILIGVQKGAPVWPQPCDMVTLREAIGDLPKLRVRADHEIGAEVLPYDGPLSDFARRARKRCGDDTEAAVFDHCTRAVRSDDLEAFRLMKPGTLYTDLPKHLQRYRADIFDDKYNLNRTGFLGDSIALKRGWSHGRDQVAA